MVDHVSNFRFDFIDHVLRCSTSDGSTASIPLEPQSVAQFKAAVMAMLAEFGIRVTIRDLPCEIADAIPFPEDLARRDYDRDAVQRYWRALCQVDRVFKRFRTGFLGKCKPVHFFWGSFDLADHALFGTPRTVASGQGTGSRGCRDAGSVLARSEQRRLLAGRRRHRRVVFTPMRTRSRRHSGSPTYLLAPATTARWENSSCPMNQCARADDPDGELLAFLKATYEAAADAAEWDRAALECPTGRVDVCRRP
jgi:hypothetical protein